MKTVIKIKMLAAASAVVIMTLAAPAMAATVFMRFSGAEFGNTALAEGSFFIDDSALNGFNSSPNRGLNYITVRDLVLTVSGAFSGNGVFTTSDFGPDFAFHSPSPLDFSHELVGQTLTNGQTFGRRDQSDSGDFNLFSEMRGAPTGISRFILEANGNDSVSGNRMALVSLSTTVATVVPEPATWAMMLVGFAMVGAR